MSPGPYHWSPQPEFVGGQGEVRFGTDASGRPVALKLAAGSDNAREALKREIAVLRALEEAGVSGVVELLDTVEYDGRPGLVMPRYERTLRDWIDELLATPDADSLRTVLERCAQVAETLAAVHKVTLDDGGAIVHRDVKPENILLAADGSLRLADFGGALAVDGLAAVEMGLFGTPMWAPFDQILPGLAIPDRTWDTYALCVILYACLTGARPAYQADPRELLSVRGRHLWDVAKRAIAAEGAHQRTLRAEFTSERQGTSADDIVSMTGRSALNEADRRVLMAGVDGLAERAGLPRDDRDRLMRGVWGVLVRGLSPVSHPSPPNRYRDAEELAHALRDLLRVAYTDRSPRDLLAGPQPGPDLELDGEGYAPRADEGGGLVLIGVVIVAVVAGGIALTALLGPLSRPSPQVDVPATTVTLDGLDVRVAAFRIDRTEVTRGQWVACVDAGACEMPTVSGPDDVPVSGLRFEQADAYCTFRGGRLPSEAEWHAVAGDSLFPWGEDAPTCDHAIAQGCGEQLAPAGSARRGATPLGVVDLAGNVWEWARVGKGGDRGVLLGGSLTSPASELGRRARLLPSGEALPDYAGLRCAYD